MERATLAAGRSTLYIYQLTGIWFTHICQFRAPLSYICEGGIAVTLNYNSGRNNELSLGMHEDEDRFAARWLDRIVYFVVPIGYV